MDNDIIDLWPTKLLKKVLPSANGPNRELIILAKNLSEQSDDLTTNYRSNNPFEIDSPSTNWLRQNVNQTMVEYLQSLGINFGVNWHIHGWINVNGPGDYHDPHNHPH
ncbi:MAG: hypothetical protein VX617_07695, partial [Pseudomonadota bacterium]|nr:hypothetical protein [Pseudomonadota bacterium]